MLPNEHNIIRLVKDDSISTSGEIAILRRNSYYFYLHYDYGIDCNSDALSNCYYCHNLEHSAGAVSFWGKKDKIDTKEYVQGLCDESLKLYKGEIL